jgi:hypothetical protein
MKQVKQEIALSHPDFVKDGYEAGEARSRADSGCQRYDPVEPRGGRGLLWTESRRLDRPSLSLQQT